jgi:transposase-like protein
MARKRYSPDEIIGKLRSAEVWLGEGLTVAEVVRRLGVQRITYYRWRKECGETGVDQAKHLKEPEAENARLRKAVSDLTLDKVILKEAAEG